MVDTYTPIKPKEVTIKDIDGVEHSFRVSRFPATVGREILAKYPVSNIPKLGQYVQSEEAMLTLTRYTEVKLSNGEWQQLATVALINSHVPDGETLLKLEFQMLHYNTSFFGVVGSSDLVTGLVKKYLPLIIETLTQTLAPSSPPDSQPSANSKQSMT